MDKKEKKKWVPYWNQKTPAGEWKMYARRKCAKYYQERKWFGIVIILGGMFWVALSRLPAGYHWQDDIPARFGLSLGKFMFYLLLTEGLCLILILIAVLHWILSK